MATSGTSVVSTSAAGTPLGLIGFQGTSPDNELRQITLCSGHRQLGEAVAGLLVADHDDAHRLTVTSTWCKARVVDDAIQHVVGQRFAGELARGERGAHHVVEVHRSFAFLDAGTAR
jgi:hypothetical protein